jgi:phosphatidate cytidylyltransferase
VLRLRVLSAAIGVPILLLLAGAGGWWYVGLVVAGALLGAYEMLSMLTAAGFRPIRPVGYVLTAAIVLDALTTDVRMLPALLVLGMLFGLLLAMGRPDTSGAIVDWALTLASAAYVGGTMYYLVALRFVPDGLLWIILVLVCSWVCDIAAFFVGRRWGKTKLAPRLSPGKSVEGAVGGLLAAVVAAIVLGPFLVGLMSGLGMHVGDPIGGLRLVGLGLVIGVCGIAGDLVESFIKRQCGTKDSSSLIPGHGGVLDRIDSWLLAAVGAYFFVVMTTW